MVKACGPRCLQCGHVDRLVRVAAVVRAGRTTSVVRGRLVGPYGYPAPFEARVTHTSSLARTLAPPARLRPPTGAVIATATTGLLTLSSLRMALTGPGSVNAWVITIVFATVAVGCTAILRTRNRHIKAARPVVEGAIRLWQSSWYCHRCAIVSVLRPSGSTTVHARDLAASLIELSRRRQWQTRGG